MVLQSTCSACSYIVRHRLLRCQTILLVAQLLALTLVGHVDMAFILLVFSILLVSLVFAEGMFRVAVMLTHFTSQGHEHGLELGAAIIESLHKSPFYTAALALAIQSYYVFVATRTHSAASLRLMSTMHEPGERTDGMAILQVPALKKQINKCHQRISITIILWIAIISCYSLFTLASVPLTSSRLPHIYAVFAVFLLVSFLGLMQGFELLCQQCCNKRTPSHLLPNTPPVVVAAKTAAVLDQEQLRKQKEAAIMEFAREEEKRRREGTLDNIAVNTNGADGQLVGRPTYGTQHRITPELEDSVARIKQYVKPVTGLLIEDE